ncbi:RNA polymerase II transcription factor B subunit 4 [Thelotrema lepadinum]|nr:RNA polymerase II transcription factor B subunit 4 [Thelotrema lepadinum]
MDNVDASEHYTRDSDEPSPSFLTIILDTNPIAWAHLGPTLPLSSAISALLVFINAHLAFSQVNKVAVIASHVDRAEFLYPSDSPRCHQAHAARSDTNGDISMRDAPLTTVSSAGQPSIDDANFYRPFATISHALTSSLQALLASTPPASLTTPTTALAGALTLALANANKLSSLISPPFSSNPTNATMASTSASGSPSQSSRILILSASPASPSQYIPLMNTIFAAARLSIPIDVFALTPTSSPFLQQAASTTHGTFLSLQHPHGLLQTLLQAFLPTTPSRGYLIPATQSAVDFRAACFCHRKVVDVGFVCSICLSIFCEVPEGHVCLTCGTRLKGGEYGNAPVVVGVKGRGKKKRKREGEGGTGTGTPGVA